MDHVFGSVKFACSKCTQRFEVDDSWPGGQVDCPTCGEVVLLPKSPVVPPMAEAAAEVRAGGVLRKSQRDLQRWRRAKILRQWAVCGSAAALLVAGYMSREEWLGFFQSSGKVAPSADLARVEEKAESVVSLKVPVLPMQEVPLAQPEAMEEDTRPSARASVQERPQALEWLVGNKRHWPVQVALEKTTKFPVVFQGRAAGEVTLSVGAKVDVVEIRSDAIEVRFRDGVLLLPHEATDLAAIAPAIRDQAEAEVAARASRPFVPAEVTTAPIAAPALRAEAGRIDGIIKASLVKSGGQPPATVSDERFVRRTYLVAIGRMPTSEEAAAFLTDPDPHKRANLVSQLLRSPGYASQMSNWVFDRLRVVDHSNVSQIRYPAYRQWVRRAVEENMPWDAMVSTLLTAQGGGWDEGTAPVGYYTRDRGMPLDNLAITMRVFLGSRMECAQCHNDPFGDTKQKDFFRLAAFTSGQGTMKQDLFGGIFREMDAAPQTSLEHRTAWMFWRDVYGNSLAGGGTGRIALPDDYQYKDARPGDVVGARAPFGKTTSLTGTRDRDDSREKMAEWMTKGTGDRFAGMIANSMWKKVMGAGFFEPSDEYIEPEETHDPKLSAHLAKLMVQLDYNLRDYQEVLLLTEAFQSVPNTQASVAVGGADDFLGRRVQRMTAEQVWDSLVTLVAGNPDNQPPREMDDRIYVEGRPVLEGQMTMSRLSREVLAIEDEVELREYFLNLVAKISAEQNGGSMEATAAMMSYGGDPVGFVRVSHPRASELPSPAPRNHFLALFGQSDREVVDGATREPNIGQVLSLMNGFVQREIVGKPEALLNRELESATMPEEKIRKLSLAIFSREPTAEELTMLAEEFEHSPEAAQGNIASAMLMSAEFLYLQ